ncbi:MAG: thioesterase family protein [Myxococcota bacterium]
MTRFERDSAATRAADGHYDVRIDGAWWIVVGPNGGYIAALFLRALQDAVGDATRAPRSLTVHYVTPGVEGPARVRVRTERSGRSLTSLSARLEQDGKLVALALATFARSRDALEFQDLQMPEVAPPEALPEREPVHGRTVPMRARFHTRPAFDGVESGSASRTIGGGWMRLAEPRVPDAAALAMFCDAWPPTIAQRQALGTSGLRGVPTIDLTVHFRAPAPSNARPDDFYLCVFRTQTARGGFLEEDGEIWTRDGLLLAQSRQLAMLI